MVHCFIPGNDTYGLLTQLWYDSTHADERIDDYASSIHYCFEHGEYIVSTEAFQKILLKEFLFASGHFVLDSRHLVALCVFFENSL